MAFAIFYNPDDLTPIENECLKELSGSDRRLARDLWNGGLKDWRTAPLDTSERGTGDPHCRRVVVSGITLSDLRGFLFRRWQATNVPALFNIWNDLAGQSAAVEPWV